jgi:hypothetical protein
MVSKLILCIAFTITLSLAQRAPNIHQNPSVKIAVYKINSTKSGLWVAAENYGNDALIANRSIADTW